MVDPKELADRLQGLRERLKPVFTTLLKVDDLLVVNRARNFDIDAVGASQIVDRVDDDLFDIIVDVLREHRTEGDRTTWVIDEASDSASWLRWFADQVGVAGDPRDDVVRSHLRHAADLLDGDR